MTSDLLPMIVRDMAFLIDKLHEDCSLLQFLRELTKNSIEAIQRKKCPHGKIRWDVHWNRYEPNQEATYKLCVIDNACWSAEAQGIMIQRAMLIEGMREAIEITGPGPATRIQGLHNLLHEVDRTAGRLVARMSDRAHSRTERTEPIGGYYIGWLDSFKNCPECGYEVQPKSVVASPTVELVLDDTPVSIKDKTNFDR